MMDLWRALWRRSRRSLFSPATRIAMGLVSLMVLLMLVAELLTGFPPSREVVARQQRAQVASMVGERVAGALRAGAEDSLAVQRALGEARRLEPSLHAMAVLDENGRPLASVGDHAALWRLGPQDASTLENMRVPLLADGQPWGQVQLVFKSVWPRTLEGWLREPLVRWLALVGLLGWLGFSLYLRRMLRHLDPNAAVPERVRDAFDTLTECVLVLDEQGRIMLANRAFCALRGHLPEALTGMEVRRLEWLTQALPPQDAEPAPWRRAQDTQQVQLGIALSIEAADGRRELVMNCAPIVDGRRVRGCLATFSDVTELHHRTERLRLTLQELSASQQEIERKNEELTILATRDALTGIFNRRSLMQQAQQRFAQARAQGAPLACIMCDIDHFKSVNDKYGHGGGDQVIHGAAQALQRGLAGEDFAGRYGGEEFCLLLPGRTARQTLEVAQRIRADIEANLGAALRDHPGVRVTMSFGVSELTPHVADVDALIDLADQALYHAKKNGRNRVTVWQADLAATAAVS
jgi:diguanylate cyclase (GGDEF)-like protein/PAS domain S-box-containing protein